MRSLDWARVIHTVCKESFDEITDNIPIPTNGVLYASGLIAALALVAIGSAHADVIADFNAVAARTATPPVAYTAVTPEEGARCPSSTSRPCISRCTTPWSRSRVATSPTRSCPQSPARARPPRPLRRRRPAQCSKACSRTARRSTSRLRAVPARRSSDAATAKGITLGVEVGQKMLLERANDGRETSENYVPSGVVGASSLPRRAIPVWHFAPYMRAFTLIMPRSSAPTDRRRSRARATPRPSRRSKSSAAREARR